MKRPFTIDAYKTVLANMHSVILPTITDKLLLADFLTDSYNVGMSSYHSLMLTPMMMIVVCMLTQYCDVCTGGVVSLLALNGLFVLIRSHNLDYPNFYHKLYRLCQPSVFHAKYRSRFYRLVALFLTSRYAIDLSSCCCSHCILTTMDDIGDDTVIYHHIWWLHS